MIRAAIETHSNLSHRMETAAAWLIPTLARTVFALTLLVYFWNSAGTKIDGSIFTPSAGAFGQIFPAAAEAAFYDVGELTILQRLVIFAGTIAEFTLPAMIVTGLFTRLAALGMIGFVFVQTFVDVTGHGAALGNWLNASPDLLDQRTMWVFLLTVLFVRGAGPLSIDALIVRGFSGRRDRATG